MRRIFKSTRYVKDTLLSKTRCDIWVPLSVVLAGQGDQSLELLGDSSAALESYQGVVTAVNSVTSAKDCVFIEWAEEGLYRASLLALRTDTNYTALASDILRTYQLVTSTQPTNWRLKKRLTVARHSLTYLIEIYRRGVYDPPESESDAQATFMVEATKLRMIYETMLLSTATFPRADQVNTQVLEFVDQLAELVELAPWSVSDLRAFAEAFNRATQKAFNSPRITRHQFRVQVKLGEYKEAHYVFRTYMYLVGFITQAQYESRMDGEALASDSDGQAVPIPTIKPETIRQMVHDRGEVDDGNIVPGKSIASRRTVEKESTTDVLEVLLLGVKMFCEDLDKGSEAVEVAEIARNVFDMEFNKQKESWKSYGARVYRAAGTAYGLLGAQTMDPTMRPEYHGKALEYLEESLNIAETWETYYQLTLERGEARDIPQAIQYISKALQLNPKHIPSWHMLVLLCSCPAQGDMHQALKSCTMALEKAQDVIDQYNENDISNTDFDTRPGFDDLMQYVLLETTHSMLVNAAKGPEDALESQKNVFVSYNLISVPDDTYSQTNGLYDDNSDRNSLVVSGSLGNLSETGPVESDTTEKRSLTNGNTENGVSKNGSLRSLVGRRGLQNGKANSVRTEPIPNHHHRLHLFRGRTLRRHKNPTSTSLEDSASSESRDSLFSTTRAHASYPMQASVTSLQSAVPSLSSTRSIQPRGSISSAHTRPTARCRLRQKRSTRILCNLWLLSASYFLNMGRIDEAVKAVEEAENVDWTANARLWCTLGRVRLAQNMIDWAITAFQKGLVCESNDVECRVWLAKAYQEQGNLEIAEGILELVTRGNGWNCAEAWFYLGEVYRKTERIERAKDCLLYALELEKTQPIQSFSMLPRYV
ncbi:hypothetical protein BJV82DRAFT_311037 [Fennellomyces sp. T-0311]|nr:hypothetical protein BJV82DRAFT_311037 [Fennellomyces sp. T-0311]